MFKEGRRGVGRGGICREPIGAGLRDGVKFSAGTVFWGAPFWGCCCCTCSPSSEDVCRAELWGEAVLASES